MYIREQHQITDDAKAVDTVAQRCSLWHQVKQIICERYINCNS